MYVRGQLLKAQLENSASDLTPVSTGLIYFNTATNFPKCYNGAVWKTLVDDTTAQSLTNKNLGDVTNVLTGATAASFTTGAAQTVTLPTATSTLATKTLAETLTNKTLTTPIVDILTLTESATPATPSSGFGKVYPKSDSKLYYLDDQGIETQLGGSSGSGSGEINTITNPSAATDTTGWTAGTSHTATRDTSNSPLSPVTSSCFDVAATTTAAESSTSGVYWTTSTQPTGLRNRKLKVEFYFTTSASQTWNLGVYAGSTRMALSTDASGATIIPAGVTGGKFTAYFDADSSTAYTIHFTRTAGSGTTHLYITNVINGPGIQPQGLAGTEWVSYTPTVSGNGSKVFTTEGKWRRVGDTMEIQVEAAGNATASGAATATNFTISLPSGFNMDTTKICTTTNGDPLLGSGAEFSVVTASQYQYQIAPVYVNGVTDSFAFLKSGGSVNYRIGDLNAARTMFFNAHVFVPISQWSGSGTVNVAQNDVEYYYTTDTWDGAGSTTGYGPAGQTIPGALTADRTKTIALQTPMQQGDALVVELLFAGDWVPSPSLYPYVRQNATFYGTQLIPVSTTSVSVVFYRYAEPSGATYGAAGAAWAAGVSAWRLKKTKAGVAVGFGIVSSTAAGLYPAVLSNLDDQTATRQGQKIYLADASGGTNDVAYNGGLKATIAFVGGAGTAGSLTNVIRAQLIPYQMQNGSWRVKFNIAVNFSTTARTIARLSVNGLATGSTSDQAIACSVPGVSVTQQKTDTNLVAVYASTSTTDHYYSGDVIVDSKPTWAY